MTPSAAALQRGEVIERLSTGRPEVSYVKLDRALLSSSLWIMETAEAIKVWFYLLLGADPWDGIVRETLPAIARNNGLAVDRVSEILDRFASPDPYSRTPTADGRRIIITRDPQWQIQIVNYLAYARKDHTAAARKRRQRERERAPEESRRDVTVSRVTDRDVTQRERKRKRKRKREKEKQHTDSPADAGALAPLDDSSDGPTTNGNGALTATATDKPEARQGCEDLSRILGRPLNHSNAKLQLFERLLREGRTRDEWCAVLQAMADRSVSSATFARDGDGVRPGGPGVVWALRPGEKGGFDRILLQLEDANAAHDATIDSSEREGLSPAERAARAAEADEIWRLENDPEALAAQGDELARRNAARDAALTRVVKDGPKYGADARSRAAVARFVARGQRG